MLAEFILAAAFPPLATLLILIAATERGAPWAPPYQDRFPRFDCWRSHERPNPQVCRACGREVGVTWASSLYNLSACQPCYQLMALRRAAHKAAWKAFRFGEPGLANWAARRAGRRGFAALRAAWLVHLATSNGWLLWAWRFRRNRRRYQRYLARWRGDHARKKVAEGGAPT